MDTGNLDARSTIDDACHALPVPSKSRLLVAVSGGPDSVALLRALVRVAPDHGWQLRVCHVNHHLRGEHSDADEAFVRELAELLALSIDVRSISTVEYAAGNRLSTETAARELRHEALGHALREWPGDAIVMAHTKNDQAETLLLHLLRGSGLEGLGGMRVANAQLLRPLLAIDRPTVIRALQADRQGYRVDSSNAEDDNARGRLRKHIIPSLQVLQHDPVEVLARSALLLQDDADLLAAETHAALNSLQIRSGDFGLTLDRASLNALHPSLRRSVLRAAVRQVRGDLLDVTEDQINSLSSRLEKGEGSPGSALRLPGRIAVVWERLKVTLVPGPAQLPEPPAEESLTIPGRVELATGTLRGEILNDAAPAEVARMLEVCGPDHALLDADALKGPLTAGPRRPGDRFRPLGLQGTKKVQDLFVDRNVPRDERERRVIVRNAEHIVWIPGEGVDERVAIRASSHRVAHLVFWPKS